jgi:DNA polymerase-3 subunit alpha
MQENITHLQLHTEYSFFEGMIGIKKLAKEIKKYKINAVAITDYGNMFGAIEFYNIMKNEGIKPIIGLEIYVYDKAINKTNLVSLYAKNNTGYKNLIYLSSIVFLQEFDEYPKIDKDILFKKSQGLICIDTYLQDDELDLVKNNAFEYKKIFGCDFYIGIIKYNNKHINHTFLTISKKYDIKLVALNNTSFLKQEDADVCKIFLDIATYKLKRPKYLKNEFYLKSSQELVKLYTDIPQAINNIREIVDKCNLELKFGNPTPLNYKFTTIMAKEKNITLPEPNKEYSLANDMVLFEYECKKGLKEKLKHIPKEKYHLYWDRLNYEISIIKNMKFQGYMLIVWDFINYARSKNIPIGPGRGSVTGSLVSYVLKITDINPIFHGLLFERFINPKRDSLINIDINISQNKRDEVVYYIIKKYGKENVAKIITFKKIFVSEALKDVAKVLNISHTKVDKITKLISDEFDKTLQIAYKNNPQIKIELQGDNKLKKLWEYAVKLEGLTKDIGFNSSGLVISNKTLSEQVPLLRLDKQEISAIQYSGQKIEDIDLIKFNLVEFSVLDTIDNILKLILKNHNQKIDFSTISINDKRVFKTICSKDTSGIFLIDTEGMRHLIKTLKPDSFEDFSAMFALYRPGPLECGMLDNYIDRKHNIDKIDYFFNEFEKPLKPILGSTYGIIVYQEQIMQILQIIGGFDLCKADLIRRAMSEKTKELDRLKDEFVKGGVKNGYLKKHCEELFDLITKFAKYGFIKSHIIAYAMTSYQMAYLKTYYFDEFNTVFYNS